MADLSDIERMVNGWERNAAEKAERYQRMQEEVAQIIITESVANGAVSVTVGANGIPTTVAMTDAVRTMTPDEIADAVMKAMHKAQSRYPDRIREIVAETVGEDDASRHIIETAERSFPPPPADDEPTREEPGRELRIENEDDQEQPPPHSRQPRRRPDDDDEDFGDQSHFSRN